MKLILTRHVNMTSDAVVEKLDRAVSVGLDAASDPLTGSEVRVNENGPLTTLQVAVPWTEADTGSPKLWAAVRFTEMIVDEVSAAA
ncbi:MAG: hypothetical protein GY724_07610 [Actinomycetia bacterium]|nr:hypothetical protein [Actinomycetes bacterium]MCP5034726.1 hypothetical protein [Actinomycetes bacterium]